MGSPSLSSETQLEIFRQLVEAVDQVFYVTSLDYRIMHYVSPSYEKLWGRSAQSLYENPASWMESIHQDDKDRIREELKKNLDKLQFEYRIVRPDGMTRWILATVSVVMDPGGNAVRRAGTAIDVTERKRARLEVKAKDELIRLLLDSTAEAICGVDLEANCTFANRACLDILGFKDVASLLGRNVHWLFHGRKPDGSVYPAEQCPVLGPLRDGKPFRGSDETFWRADQTPFPVEYWSYPIFRDEKLAGAVLTFIDITEKTRLEAQYRQAQKMEGIGRLAGGIAHDFNNLLTAISGYGHFLAKAIGPDDPKHADVAEIMRAADRAAALTRQLLAFSRRQMLNPKVIDLNAVIAEMEKMLRRIIGENVRFSFKSAAALGRVKADPGQIDQIIMNLAVNARDAMPDGGELTIETANVELGKDYCDSHPGSTLGPHVMISISDTGTGMSPAVQSHLFEPFFTTKEQGKGTGLGLATVYGIVKQSGGTIYVYSELGYGTVFKIYLPQVIDPLDDGGTGASKPDELRGHETVLLVEDDPMVRRFAARVLRESGYKILEAAAPGEAVRICERDDEMIALLLSDVVMPQMRGHELAKQISALRPGIKTVFMSGYTDLSTGEVAKGAFFLQKPMTAEALLRKIREALGRGS